MREKFWMVIPAAGVGNRMKNSLPKQYLRVLGKTILEHTLHQLLQCEKLTKLVVVVADNDEHWPTLAPLFPADKIITAYGGKERVYSVLAGVLALADLAAPTDWLLVHDAVRPCITSQAIEKLIHTVSTHEAIGGLLGIPVSDTLKRVDTHGRVLSTLDRSGVWQAQTPQMFRFNRLLHALQNATHHDLVTTDEASTLEQQLVAPEELIMVEGSRDNIKITHSDDLMAMISILKKSEV